jgi:hypothetical protein
VDSNDGEKDWISGGYFDSGYVGCRIGDHAVIRFFVPAAIKCATSMWPFPRPSQNSN